MIKLYNEVIDIHSVHKRAKRKEPASYFNYCLTEELVPERHL